VGVIAKNDAKLALHKREPHWMALLSLFVFAAAVVDRQIHTFRRPSLVHRSTTYFRS
jgi:hypothetical protein